MSRWYEITANENLTATEILDNKSGRTPYVVEVRINEKLPKTQNGVLILYIKGEVQDLKVNDWKFTNEAKFQKRNWENDKQIHFEICCSSTLEANVKINSSSSQEETDLVIRYMERMILLSLCQSKKQYKDILEILNTQGKEQEWGSKLWAERLWSFTQFIMNVDAQRNAFSSSIINRAKACYFKSQLSFLHKLAHT